MAANSASLPVSRASLQPLLGQRLGGFERLALDQPAERIADVHAGHERVSAAVAQRAEQLLGHLLERGKAHEADRGRLHERHPLGRRIAGQVGRDRVDQGHAARHVARIPRRLGDHHVERQPVVVAEVGGPCRGGHRAQRRMVLVAPGADGELEQCLGAVLRSLTLGGRARQRRLRVRMTGQPLEISEVEQQPPQLRTGGRFLVQCPLQVAHRGARGDCGDRLAGCRQQERDVVGIALRRRGQQMRGDRLGGRAACLQPGRRELVATPAGERAELLVDGMAHQWMQEPQRPAGGEHQHGDQRVGRLGRHVGILEAGHRCGVFELGPVGEQRHRPGQRDGLGRHLGHAAEHQPRHRRRAQLIERRPRRCQRERALQLHREHRVAAGQPVDLVARLLLEQPPDRLRAQRGRADDGGEGALGG